MAITFENFGFFDYQEGDSDTYRYNAEEFSTIISGICGDGVNAHYGEKFAVKAQNGLNLTIGSGACWVHGRYAYNASECVYTLTPATSAGRKDIIAAHLDTTGRIMEIVQVEGTTSDYPTLTADYLPLYNITVTATSATEVADSRAYNYGSTNYPAAQIIYSATTPAVVNGAVWLKPIS